MLCVKISLFFLHENYKHMCGPRILVYAFPLDGKLDFYFENDFICSKMTWSRHLFLFYF